MGTIVIYRRVIYYSIINPKHIYLTYILTGKKR